MASSSSALIDENTMEKDVLVSVIGEYWTNVRHNETQRNKLFSFYLIVLGAFLVAADKEMPGFSSNESLLFISTTAWFIGVLIMWSIVRYREMINRDKQIIDHFTAQLFAIYPSANAVVTRLNQYKTHVYQRQILRYFSTTICIIVAVSTISAAMLAYGALVFFGFPAQRFPAMFVACVGVNSLLLLVMLRVMVPRYGEYGTDQSE